MIRREVNVSCPTYDFPPEMFHQALDAQLPVHGLGVPAHVVVAKVELLQKKGEENKIKLKWKLEKTILEI